MLIVKDEVEDLFEYIDETAHGAKNVSEMLKSYMLYDQAVQFTDDIFRNIIEFEPKTPENGVTHYHKQLEKDYTLLKSYIAMGDRSSLMFVLLTEIALQAHRQGMMHYIQTNGRRKIHKAYKIAHKAIKEIKDGNDPFRSISLKFDSVENRAPMNFNDEYLVGELSKVIFEKLGEFRKEWEKIQEKQKTYDESVYVARKDSLLSMIIRKVGPFWLKFSRKYLMPDASDTAHYYLLTTVLQITQIFEAPLGFGKDYLNNEEKQDHNGYYEDQRTYLRKYLPGAKYDPKTVSVDKSTD